MIQAKRYFVAAIVVLTILSATVNASLAQTSSGANNSSAAGNSGVNPHAISLYNLGLNAYKQGSPESAIIFFKRATDLDPDLADAQYNLGVLYQSEKRLKEAVPRFREALRVKPEDADSHYQLGLALIDLNQLADARQQLMAIAPNNSHFADAQKKVAFIDSQVSGGANTQTIAQNVPSNSTQATTGQSNNNGINAVNATNSSVSDVPSANASSTAGGAGNSSVAVATPTTAAVSAVASSLPNSASNPVAAIDGVSAQVIASGFSAPSGLTFDRQGNLYVANFVTNTIDRLAADGTRSQFSSGINLKGPIGLISDDESNIYVANYLAGTVTRINPAGIAQIIVNGLKKPYYLARDKQGNLFVSQQEDNTIVRINLPHNGAGSEISGQSSL